MRLTLSIACLFAAVAASDVRAQAPGVPIERGVPENTDKQILNKAATLREAGKLRLNIETAGKQTAHPEPGAITLPEANKDHLPGREVAQRAREASVKFGWYYLCKKCDHWHLKLAAAYAVAPDAVATCQHCVKPGDDMREGYLIAVDHTGEVLPVTSVLAANDTMDAAILRVGAATLKPLPLNDNTAPGDSVYCFSTPLGQTGYFSQGIVNRFYWRNGKAGKDGDWSNLRVNVSTDWAPGSSGAAVLDAAGNAVGHVATIQPMREGGARPAAAPGGKDEGDGKPAGRPGDRFGGATLITLHDATPARAVLSLAKPLTDLAAGGLASVPEVDAGPVAPPPAPADAAAAPVPPAPEGPDLKIPEAPGPEVPGSAGPGLEPVQPVPADGPAPVGADGK